MKRLSFSSIGICSRGTWIPISLREWIQAQILDNTKREGEISFRIRPAKKTLLRQFFSFLSLPFIFWCDSLLFSCFFFSPFEDNTSNRDEGTCPNVRDRTSHLMDTTYKKKKEDRTEKKKRKEKKIEIQNQCRDIDERQLKTHFLVFVFVILRSISQH